MKTKPNYPIAKVFHTGAFFGVKVCFDHLNNYTKRFDSKGDALRYVDDLIRYEEIKSYKSFLGNATPTWGA